MDGSLFERGKALEDRFFSEKDKQLLDQLKAEMATEEIRHSLAAACGIENEHVLDALIANKISAESLTSVALIPLIAVAWADGQMASQERKAILQAAKDAGIESGTAAYSLLESWLNTKPQAELLQSWKSYIAAMKQTLDETTLKQLKNSVIGRAKQVANAAGGILGIGATSDDEAQVIAELEKAFD